MPRRKEKMTDRDKMFVSEYLVDHNATKAIQRCGYKGKRPDVVGHQTLSKPWVKEMIAVRAQKKAEKAGVNAQWVLDEAVANYKQAKEFNSLNPADLFETNGSLKPISKWPKVWQNKQLIAGMENTELFGKDNKGNSILRGHLKKLRLSDHKSSEATFLKMIGEHVGIGAFNQTINAKISGDATQDAIQVDTLDVTKLTLEELIAYRAIRKKASGSSDES